MGIQTVENCGDTLAVILENHGVIALGASLKEALYSCVYLEEAAKTYILPALHPVTLPVLPPPR